MKRLFGWMPNSEVELHKSYRDELGMVIHIEAGKSGWTIIYADGSTEYSNQARTAEENFAAALEVLSSHFHVQEIPEVSEVSEVSEEVPGEVPEEFGNQTVEITKDEYFELRCAALKLKMLEDEGIEETFDYYWSALHPDDAVDFYTRVEVLREEIRSK